MAPTRGSNRTTARGASAVARSRRTPRVVPPSDRVTRSRTAVNQHPPPPMPTAGGGAAPQPPAAAPGDQALGTSGEGGVPVSTSTTVPDTAAPPHVSVSSDVVTPPPAARAQPSEGSFLAAVPPAPPSSSSDNIRALNALLMAEREQHERQVAEQTRELEALRARLTQQPSAAPPAAAPLDLDSIVAGAVRAALSVPQQQVAPPPPPSAPVLIPGVPADVAAAARTAVITPTHPAYGLSVDRLLELRAAKPTGEKPRLTLSLDAATDVTTAVASFRPWELQLQSKFTKDFAVFLTDREKVEYAMRFISGKLLTALEGWFCDPSTTVTYDGFLNEVKTSIGFDNQRASARRALEKLVQGSDDVTTYFNNLRFQWNLGNVPLRDRVSKFVASLRRDISVALDSVDFGDDLYQALEAARRVENAQLQRNLELSRTNATTSAPLPFQQRKSFGPKFNRPQDYRGPNIPLKAPSTTPTPPIPSSGSPPLKESSGRPGKFDIPSDAEHKFNERFPRCAQKPDGWLGPWWDPEINPKKLSEADQRLLYSQRRCWRCRGSGHRVGDACCPHEDGTSAARRAIKPQLAVITAQDPTTQGVSTSINSDGEVCNDVCIPPPHLHQISLSSLSSPEPVTKAILQHGRHLVLNGNINQFQARSLVDNGSEATLISGPLADKLSLPLYSLKRNIPLVNASKRLHSVITQATVFPYQLNQGDGSHSEYLIAYIAPIPTYDVILGDPWLRTHDPTISFADRIVTFNARICRDMGCLPQGKKCTIRAEDFIEPPPPPTSSTSPSPEIESISASAYLRAASQPHNSAYMVFCEGAQATVCTISVNATFTKDDLNTHLAGPPQYTLTDILQRLPTEVQDFADVFSREDADTLPPHRPGIDHEIHIIPGSTLPTTRNYRPHSQPEQEAIAKQVRELNARGYIRPSNSSVCSPLLCVSKPGGGIRVCTDLRAINDITIKSRFPIPLLQDILNLLILALWFSKFDIIHAFNRIRMAPGHEYLTSFICRLGQFEWLVMPFGACNAPATFQSFINSIFFDILDKYVTAYLDDILVFSTSWEEHVKHVREVLSRLRHAQLNLDIDKTELFVHKVKYLGVIISRDGISMDPSKIQAIQEWKQPTSVLDVQSFLGFVNHYRRFAPNFATLAKPLYKLTEGKVVRSQKNR